MRLSKKIREEVADYFYGRLNMRFTNSWNSFLAMTVFHYTIGPFNRNFIRHVTVGMPDSALCSGTLGSWNRFARVVERRGMRTPYIGYREKKRSRGDTEAQRIHYIAARRGFRQLGNMAGLKLLEILIPWTYLDFLFIWRPTMVACGCGKDFQSPEDQIRHFVEDHTGQRDFWALLAGLKQQSSSDDLTIALVYDYASTPFTPDSEDFEDYVPYSDIHDPLRIGRWMAAYASVMGYKFGYARSAKKGAYKVRYDQDILLSKSLERLKDDPLQYDPLLEPPKLSA